MDLKLGILIHFCYWFLVDAVQHAEVITNGDNLLTHLQDYGVSVNGKSHLLFSVKACANAVILVSDRIAISKNSGAYFTVLLGSGKNQFVQMYDSCFVCNRTRSVRAQVLECSTFKPFWIQWERKGTFRLGKGTVVGHDPILTFQGINGPYEITSAAVTSTSSENVTWHFSREEKQLSFFQPTPGVNVTVSEAATVGSVVYKIVLSEPTTEGVTIQPGAATHFFTVNNSEIILRKSLDFETNHFHLLLLSTSTGVTSFLVVLVEDVLDEVTIIRAKPKIVIPEEMPVGSVIGWNIILSDGDRNDNHSFRFLGQMNTSLEILPTGNMRVVQRIDFDTMNNSTNEALILVTDRAGQVARIKLQIVVKDINDNPPNFNETVIRRDILENATADAAVTTLFCTDKDSGRNTQYKLTIVEREMEKYFYLRDNELFARAGGLDYESQTHTYAVVVRAEDQPDSGEPLTGMAVVVVHVLPRDESPPHWISPELKDSKTFKDIGISRSVRVGTVVTVFVARDDDLGEQLQYQLHTDAFVSHFELDPDTGQLKNRRKLTKSSYSLIVTCTSGNTSIVGNLTINVVDHNNKTSSNLPVPLKFDLDVYIIKEPTLQDVGQQLVVGFVDSDKPVVVFMDSNGNNSFFLKQTHNDWKLFLRDDVFNGSALWFPSVVTLTAMTINGSQTTKAYVVIQTIIVIKQRVPTTTGSETDATLCPTESILTSTASVPTVSTRISTATRTTTVPTTRIATSSTSAPIKDIASDVKMRQKVFVGVIVMEGLLIASLAGLLCYSTRKRRCKNMRVASERDEPLGCERDMERKIEGKTRTPLLLGSHKSNNAMGSDTMLDILDETKDEQNHTTCRVFAANEEKGREETQLKEKSGKSAHKDPEDRKTPAETGKESADCVKSLIQKDVCDHEDNVQQADPPEITSADNNSDFEDCRAAAEEDKQSLNDDQHGAEDEDASDCGDKYGEDQQNTSDSVGAPTKKSLRKNNKEDNSKGKEPHVFTNSDTEEQQSEDRAADDDETQVIRPESDPQMTILNGKDSTTERQNPFTDKTVQCNTESNGNPKTSSPDFEVILNSVKNQNDPNFVDAGMSESPLEMKIGVDTSPAAAMMLGHLDKCQAEAVAETLHNVENAAHKRFTSAKPQNRPGLVVKRPTSRDISAGDVNVNLAMTPKIYNNSVHKVHIDMNNAVMEDEDFEFEDMDDDFSLLALPPGTMQPPLATHLSKRPRRTETPPKSSLAPLDNELKTHPEVSPNCQARTTKSRRRKKRARNPEEKKVKKEKNTPHKKQTHKRSI